MLCLHFNGSSLYSPCVVNDCHGKACCECCDIKTAVKHELYLEWESERKTYIKVEKN